MLTLDHSLMYHFSLLKQVMQNSVLFVYDEAGDEIKQSMLAIESLELPFW